MGEVRFGVRMHQGGYSFEELREVWVAADRLGYYSATLYDLLNVSTLECWTALSALASVTSRIRLVPLTLANTYRHPALLAKMAATLDVISGGRLELGIGAGGSGSDHRASGLAFPPTSVRVAMLEEAVALIKSLWSGGETTYRGRYYEVGGAMCAPPPVQRPHPPILIGGHGETHLLRAVAAHADISNMGFDMSVEEHGRKRQILDAHGRKVGRDVAEIDASHNARVFIAEDGGSLQALLEAQADAAGMAPDRFRASLGNAVVGTPGECERQIRRYVDSGITYIFLLFPHPIQTTQLELFAEKVMPRFA